MAVSQIHIRSISLPSRLHPINSTEFEAEVEKLKSSQPSSFSTTASLSSDAIISGLVGLAELYNSMDELTQAPSTTRRSVEDALEGSVELLDCCGGIREVAQMMRESVRALQSALRRKGSDANVASYVGSRRRMSKCIKKSLKALKSCEGRIHASDVLREVYGLTVAVFRSALLFFSPSSSAVKSGGGWSRVARLVLNKSAAHHGDVNEVGCVDLALSNGGFDEQMVQRSLQNLDCCVDGIEEGLERMFRQLVRSRVNLLNIVTNH